jgi:hypothetical protein
VDVQGCPRACNAMRFVDVTRVQYGPQHGEQALGVAAYVHTLAPRFDENSWVLISRGDNCVCVSVACFWRPPALSKHEAHGVVCVVCLH